MFPKLLKWYNKFFKKEKLYQYKFVEDVPDLLKLGTLYIINNNNFPWQVAMLCPCGCKKILHMNLMKDHNPRWRFKIDNKNKISLHPSIWRTVGCKSHFFVKKGKILWV
jgi:Family of unknown function (DUF6527)